MRTDRRPVLVLGALVACLAAACGGDEAAVGVRVTELRIVRCAGTYNGSMLRFTATNGGASAVAVVRVEVAADAAAELGGIRATLAAEPGLELVAGGETHVVCSGGLSGAFSPIWNPATVPVHVVLVYAARPEAAEQRAVAAAEIAIEYEAAACPSIPTEPCRAQ
jgi:hypothetical protein